MRVSMILAALICAGAAHAEGVVLTSKHPPKEVWEHMGRHTFAPDYTQTAEGCYPMADSSPGDWLERRHCDALEERLTVGPPHGCVSTRVSTVLPDGTDRVLDFLAEAGGFKSQVAMKLPPGSYRATVCALGENQGHEVVGMVFDDPNQGCFNSAFVGVPIEKVESGRHGYTVTHNPAQHQSTAARHRRVGFPFILDCLPEAVKDFMRRH